MLHAALNSMSFMGFFRNIAFCAAALLAVSCSEGNGTSALRLGAMSSMDYVPFLVAEQKGIYDSLGVEVDIVRFYSANDRDAAFQSGNLDGTVIDLTGAVMQQAGGFGLKAVMNLDGFFTLVAGAETGVVSPSGLSGARMSVSRNTVIDYATDMMLEAGGVPSAAVVKDEISKIPLRLEMLLSGKTDACVLPDPFASMAVARGASALCTTSDLGISVTALVFSDKAIEERKEDISLLLKGYSLAVEYMASHPRSDWSDILVEWVGVPEDLAGSMTVPDYRSEIALPSEESVVSTVEWLHSRNLLPYGYDFRALCDSSFVSSFPVR